MIRRLTAALLAMSVLMLAGVTVTASASASTTSPLPCSPPKGDAVTDQGGPVVATASVYLVYWGSYWASTGGINASRYLDNLFRGLGTSKWARTLTQYCGDGQQPLIGRSGANELAGTATDLTNPVGNPGDPQIQAKLQALAPTYKYGRKYPTGLPIPVIVLPPRHQATADLENQCSYHNWMKYTRTGPDNGSETDYQPYMVVDFGAVWDLSESCQYGLSGPLATLSVVAGHEWAEAITDPFNPSTFPGLGWGDLSKKVEIADLCEPVPVDGDSLGLLPYVNSFTLKLPTGSFRMQEMWSNEAGKSGKCVKGS